MTESTILWAAGIIFSLIVMDIGSYMMLKDKIASDHLGLAQRVTRLETVLDNIGIKMAKTLHSPDDHLGIDVLLDKYIDRNYELSLDEWNELMANCEQIENDRDLPHGVRVAAAMLNEICRHKLMMDPTQYRWWRENK